MPTVVHVPVKIRLDASEVEGRDACISGGLDAVLRRALRRSYAEVLEPREAYAGVRLHAPTFTWRLDPGTAVSRAERTRIEQLVRRTIAATVDRADVVRLARKNARLESPLTGEVREPYDPRRGGRALGAYVVPSYDDGGTTTVPMADPATAPVEQPASFDVLAVMPHDWFRTYPDIAAHEERLFARVGLGYPPSGPFGLVWREDDAEFPIHWYLRNFPGGGHSWGYFREFGVVEFENTGATLTPTRKQFLPAAAHATLEWWSGAAVFADLEKFHDERARAAMPKPELMAKAEYEGLIAAAVALAMEDTDRTREHLAFSIGGHTQYNTMSADVRRWSGVAYLAPVSETIYPDVAEGEGGGTGERGSKAKSGGDGKGAKAKAGRDGGRGSYIFLGEGEGEGAPHFPSLLGGDELPTCDEPFAGEPPLSELDPTEADWLREQMEEIAARLGIPVCEYAGRFCLNAASIIGGATSGVAESSVFGEGDLLVTPPRGHSGPKEIDFRPTASPALQFLRLLASTVPLITAFSHSITRVYSQPRHAALITGFRKNHHVGWELDFGYPLHTSLKRSVMIHFKATVRVVFMQLVHTSRIHIDARLKVFDPYAAFFEELVRAELIPAHKLEQMRSALLRVTGRGSVGKDLAAKAIEAWRSWRNAAATLVDVLDGRNPFAGSFVSLEDDVVLAPNGVYGVKDDSGRIWSQVQLDRAIALRHDTGVAIDPVMQQLISDPKLRERFTRDPSRIKEELKALLDEMLKLNEELTWKMRLDDEFAFELAPLDRNYKAQTIPGTGFQLHGVHKVAHDAIAEFFRGDIYYTFGVGDALEHEENYQTLISVLEFGTVLVLTVFCAPLALIVGAGFALHHKAVAEEKHDAYRALIDPETVLKYAQIEAEMFAADLGVVLSVIPLGRWGGKVGIGTAKHLIAREFRQAGRYATRYVSKVISLAARRAIQGDLAKSFVINFAVMETTSQLMQKLLEPVIEELQRQHMTLDQVEQLASLVEAA